MIRNLLTLFTILSVAFSCNTTPDATGRNGALFTTAAAYNDYIVTRQMDILTMVDQFGAALEKGVDTAKVVLERNSRVAGEYLADLSAMSGFNGDTTFRNAAVNSFAFYKRIFDKEYKTLLELSESADKSSTAAATVQQITQTMDAEEAALDKRFATAQRNFAQKNKVQLDTPAAPASKEAPQP